MTMTMVRETELRAELNHSCIPGVCPPDCQAARSKTELPGSDIVVSPVMGAAAE